MEERELPVGWTSATLGELSEVIRGITFPASAKEAVKSNSNVCCLRTSNIQRELLWNDVYFVDKVFVKRLDQFIRSGDVLMSMANSYELVGKVAVARELPHEAAFGAFLSAVRPLPSLDGQYLFHFLRSDSVQRQIRDGSSQTTNIANISAGRLREIVAPVAPLDEQRRIAAKLDTTLAAVDACRQRLDGLAAILKRFRQAVLAAATSGELTREWREERGLEQAWEMTSIEHIAKVGTGSTPLRSNPAFYAATGIPWITSAATSQELITSAAEHVTVDGQVASRLRIYPEGTLLVAMYGEGKTRGQVSQLGIAATINQACAAIHDPDEKHLMPFIKIALKANYFVMRDLAEGGNQPNLNLSKIKQFEICLPPNDEIFEICDRVETLFTLADQLEARLTAARKIVDRLTPALLAKAFRGELVPQDPSDEPASVLLDRIRAARQAEAGAGKPSRRGRRQAAANPDPVALEAAPVPPDYLAALLKECGALSERALLAASELEPARFRAQLTLERQRGAILDTPEDGGQVLLEASA